MPYPDELPTEEADPFAQYSIPEVCAFIHKKLGPDALRDLLARPIKGVDGKAIVQSKEDWLDYAAELRSAGLNAVADVVDEFATAALPMDDLSFCPYTPDVPANRVSWLRAQRQRQE